MEKELEDRTCSRRQTGVSHQLDEADLCRRVMELLDLTLSVNRTAPDRRETVID